MKFEYYVKNVYGVKKMYFARKYHRFAFAQLTGKKTFDETDIVNLTNLFGQTTFQEVLESTADKY